MISDRIELVLEPGWFWAALALVTVLAAILAFSAGAVGYWLCEKMPAFRDWLAHRDLRRIERRRLKRRGIVR